MARRRIFKQDEFRELGFGYRVVEENQRLMNKDGSSNVKRKTGRFFNSSDLYHHLITMPWWKFNILILITNVVINLIFACIYFFVDIDHINGMVFQSNFEKFLEAFFLSAQSITTVGYGRLNPEGIFNESIAAIESMMGLLGFALATGLLYGRFSRPIANLIFSKQGVIAPYNGSTAFMVRLANKNKSELVDTEATIVLSYTSEVNGQVKRNFPTLKLELTHINLLSMSWTLVHPIDEESPVYGWTQEDFEKNQVEFLVLIKAYEETFAQTVHARSSYRWNELVYGAKFDSIILPGPNGSVHVELNRINDHSPVPLFEEIIAD